MSAQQTWFVTGASRGMGVDITRAALAAGHRVVATGRNTDAVMEALGDHENLLVVRLDLTKPEDATTAVSAAVGRFGGIDVLVNNAGVFYAGFFEEVSPEQFCAQIETNVFGPMNVTRAVLPVMRQQRSGHVVTITSVAGIVGVDFCSAYATSKFALEGWMETLAHDVEPFGITATIVEPGFFRTELLVEGSSTIWPELSIPDYAERTASTIEGWKAMNGTQAGDPSKLGSALVQVVTSDTPPARWAAGADAVDALETKAHAYLEQADAHRDLSTSLAHE
jgi:NAD(P)-dependent dehydrogenase (short-subunit alcohol dehydrogenase family)